MAQLDRGTMCIMCQTLPLSQPNAQRHPYLKPIRRVDDADEQSTESLYHCTVCQTHWLYQRDKWDACLGFKLWQGGLQAFNRRHVPLTFPSKSTSGANSPLHPGPDLLS